MGGLTTVSAIMKQIEDVDVVYYADNGAGSYGNLSDAEIQATAYKGLKKLFASGAVLAVLACNTATVTSVEALRKRFRREIVGTEPAVRLAAGKSVTLVTAATARTLRYKNWRRRPAPKRWFSLSLPPSSKRERSTSTKLWTW